MIGRTLSSGGQHYFLLCRCSTLVIILKSDTRNGLFIMDNVRVGKAAFFSREQTIQSPHFLDPACAVYNLLAPKEDTL